MAKEGPRAWSGHDFRLADHAGLFFWLEVVPKLLVVTANDGDRVCAFLERDEGVNLSWLGDDRNVSGLEPAIINHREIGVAFLRTVVLPLVHCVIEAALVDRERLPNSMVVRRDTLALGELVQRDDELTIVIKVFRVIDVIALSLH